MVGCGNRTGGLGKGGLVLGETCSIKTGFVPSEQEAFYSSDMSPGCSQGRTTYHHTVISPSLFLLRNSLATLENAVLQHEVFALLPEVFTAMQL